MPASVKGQKDALFSPLKNFRTLFKLSTLIIMAMDCWVSLCGVCLHFSYQDGFTCRCSSVPSQPKTLKIGRDKTLWVKVWG